MQKVVLVVALVTALAVPGPVQAHQRIVNVNTGRCLDDTGWSRSPGQQLQIWGCLGTNSNQGWTMTSLGYSHYPDVSVWMYRNNYSGLCLDVRGNSYGQAPAIQWYCNSNDPAE